MEIATDGFKNIPCKKCGCVYWMNTFKMKLVPGIVTKNGKDQIKPRPSAICANCASLWENTADMKNAVPDDPSMPVFPGRENDKDT